MGEASNFDRLVSDLGSKERRDLLERIVTSAPANNLPLISESRAPEATDSEQAFAKLGIVARIVLALRGLFTGTPREFLVNELILRRVRVRILTAAPGLLAPRDATARAPFVNALSELESGCAVLQQPTEAAFRHPAGEFYALLADLHIPDLQDQLLGSMDPVGIHQAQPLLPLPDVRRQMEERLNAVLASLSDESRQVIYVAIQSLHHLNRLCFFRFQELSGKFVKDEQGEPACNLRTIKPQLQELVELLTSARHPPTSLGLKGLMLFSIRNRTQQADFDLETEVKRGLELCQSGLEAIRAFNAVVPAVDLVRYALEDYTYAPERASGREDWFAQLRAFWKARLEKEFRSYEFRHTRDTFLQTAGDFLHQSGVPLLEHYQPERAPARHALGLAFLKHFGERLFLPSMHRWLKILQVNGEFYKKDNRLEFEEAFHTLEEMLPKIHELDDRFAPDQEVGQQIEEVGKSSASHEERQQRLAELVLGEDRRALALIDEAAFALTVVGQILDGILHGEVGGRYDTLSNLGTVGGKKENKDLVAEWQSIRERAGAAANLLQQVRDLEIARR